MDFIIWWFGDHYVLSTIFTPGLSFGWCIYNGLVIRGIISFILMGLAVSK